MPGLVLGGLATPLVTAGLLGAIASQATPPAATIPIRGFGSRPLLATRGLGPHAGMAAQGDPFAGLASSLGAAPGPFAIDPSRASLRS